MTDLATTEDITDRLGRDLTDAEIRRIPGLLKDASSRMRRYCDGQQFTQATTTERLRISNGNARLPQRPATGVATVKTISGDTVAFQWDGLEAVRLWPTGFDSFAWEPWTTPPAAVDVTYTHGYPTIPDDIVGVVCSVVLRALGRAPTEGGLTSETIQGYSYSVGTIGAAGPFGLLPEEAGTLDAYRRPVGAARTDLPNSTVQLWA